MTRSRFLATALAVVLSLTAGGIAPALAEGDHSVPPPNADPPQPPSPGPNYMWQPGYWYWNGGSYVWVRGAWLVRQPGWHAFVPGHWARRPLGWVWVPAHWR